VARAVLAPTLETLSESALALLDRMLPTEVLAVPEPVTSPDVSLALT
jgi:hypothetical protein